MTHVVRKLAVQLRGPSVDPLKLPNEVSEWVHSQLTSELERVFDALATGAAHIAIDHVEVAVEAKSISHWREQALSSLRRELATALARVTHAEHNPSAALAPFDAFAIKLASYLEHGVLPWSVTSAVRASFRACVLEWSKHIASWPGRLRFLAQLQSESACRRLCELFSEPELIELLAQLSDTAREGFADRAHDWSKLTQQLVASGPAVGGSTGRAILERTLNELAVHGGELDTAIIALVRRELRRASATERWQKVADECRTASFKVAMAQLADSIPHEDHSPRPAGSVVRKSTTSAEVTAVADEIYVDHAGVVLIAAFIPTLFRRLELFGPNGLVDPGVALGVFHFLITGEVTALDYQLTLPRLLCDLPLSAYIQSSPVDASHQSECLQLLQSALDHWSIVKSSSIATLRESFLQREGRLAQTPEGHWHLHIAQRPFDMLLQHVPWNFSLIRLPWMSRALRVDWVH